MVEFGTRLELSKRPEWATFYLDYGRLKSILNRVDGRRTTQNHRRSYSQSFLLSAQDSLSDNEHSDIQICWYEFRRVLDQEIEKVVLFSLQEQGRIAGEISHLAQSKQPCLEQVANLWKLYLKANPDYGDPILRLIRDIYSKYQSTTRQVLQYVVFCELNVTAVRKILKKHDKLNPRQTLTEIYVQKLVAQTMDSHLHQLYNYGGLSAIMASLARAFDQLQQAEALVKAMMQGPLAVPPNSARNQNRRQRVRSMPLFPSDLELAASRNSDVASQQFWFLSSAFPIHGDLLSDDNDMLPFQTNPAKPPVLSHLSLVTVSKEPLLDQIHAARSRLKQSTKYVELVAIQALIFEDGNDVDNGHNHIPNDTDAHAKRRKRITSLLNLASTFLYMTNYYIVAPTSGQYALKVGSSEALAGIIIGMTPNAALIATVLYCWWSNYAYKSALLFAAAASSLGNLCYALALQRQSIQLVMIGRFLNGFGSARSINRRFIADTFSRAERTAESAAFVTAGAMGMALGPAIAALLGIWFRQFPSSNLIWTVETAPGWVMLALWTAFFVTSLLYFEEPDRSHLFGTATSNQGRGDTLEGTTVQETKPLIPSTTDTEDIIALTATGGGSLPLYRNVPVMMTLWLFFILKLVLECLLSSCATLTGSSFGWDSQRKGIFLAFLGGLMIPVNMVVAKLSQNYEDRELILGALIVMFLSAVGILDFTAGSSSSYSAIQYVAFSICLFISANVLEGPNMSLLSKTIPKEWARGTFNSGFLATEAGTGARSIGNILVSAAVACYGLDRMLNATFVPVAVLVGLSTWYTVRVFEKLVEEDDEDDDCSIKRSSYAPA